MAILKHADFEVPGFGEFASLPTAVPRYADAVNALGPVAYWRLDETVGPTLADQTTTHPLTVTGSYALSQPGALGTSTNGALRLINGSATSLHSVLPNDVSEAFTLVFWARTPASPTLSTPFIGQYISNNAGNMQISLLADGGVRYKLIGDPGLSAAANIDTDWSMFVLTRSSGGIATWYVDGQLASQSSGHGTAFNNIGLTLGAITPKVPDVFLDEVAVFHNDLSADQSRWLFSLGRGQLALPPSS